MIRRETIGKELKKIVVYDKRRMVLAIQNPSTTINVYITDKPKDDQETPFWLLAPSETIVFAKAFGDEPEISYYAKADDIVTINIIETYSK